MLSEADEEVSEHDPQNNTGEYSINEKEEASFQPSKSYDEDKEQSRNTIIVTLRSESDEM